jgi:DNA repair exonuclease SbcCD ATPase subunit
MKLVLQNFRCYKGKHEFIFDDEGMTLISGGSGVGKTTLLMAIYFAITGNCPPKVVSDGCDSCSVSLTFVSFVSTTHSEITITRTRRPNRVVVVSGTTYLEDDLAQQYIYRHFGRFFEITSYVQQQYQKTFLYQSPTEKLEILEKLCFDEEFKPEEIKQKCSNHYKKLTHEHISLKSRYDTLVHLIQQTETQTLPEPIDKPCPSQLEQFKTKQTELQSLEQQYYTQLRVYTQVEEYQTRLVELEQEYKQHKQQRDQRKAHVYPTRNNNSANHIEYTERQLQDHLHAQKQLNQLEKHISQDIWKKHSKTDCEELIADYERDIQYHKEYQTIQQRIQECLKIDEQSQSVSRKKQNLLDAFEGQFECPECHTHLCLLNNELVHSTDSTGSKSNPYIPTTQKRKLIRELDQQLEQYQKQLQSFEHYKNKKTEIEKYIDPTENVSDLEQDYQWIRQYYQTNLDYASKQQLVEQQRKHIQEQIIPHLDSETAHAYLEHMAQEKRLKDKIQYVESQLETLKIQNPRQQNTTSMLDIQNIKSQIELYTRRIAEYTQQQHDYEMYQLKLAQYNKFKEQQNQAQQLEKELQSLEQKMTATLELKQLILRTESEIIDQKILDISKCVNEYLSNIFTEPITVELKTIKKTQTQNEKVQIQLEVYYKNMKCDVSLLSGGEQARMNLAFILAFASIFKSPLLLLDECTSHLDQDLTEIVIEHIHSIGIPKIILIAHQIVEGNFKQILSI